MKLKRIIATALFVLSISAGQAFSAQILVNGGFEQGLLGWNLQENVTTTGLFGLYGVTISPYEGSRMAYLGVSGTESSADAKLGQTFSTNGYSSPATFSFAYNLWAYDFSSLDIGSDQLAVSITGRIDSSLIFDIPVFLQISPINDPRDPSGSTQVASTSGWQYQSFLYDGPLPQGDFSLEFTLANNVDLGGDPGQKFKAFVDSVSIDAAVPVPEPGTMLLLGSGLIGLAGLGRKKFRNKKLQ